MKTIQGWLSAFLGPMVEKLTPEQRKSVEMDFPSAKDGMTVFGEVPSDLQGLFLAASQIDTNVRQRQLEFRMANLTARPSDEAIAAINHEASVMRTQADQMRAFFWLTLSHHLSKTNKEFDPIRDFEVGIYAGWQVAKISKPASEVLASGGSIVISGISAALLADILGRGGDSAER
jgi:hypothetical protein